MFFLTKCILARLFECKEFLEKVDEKQRNKDAKINLSIICDRPVVVKIESVLPIMNERKRILFYLVKVFDGKIRKDCILDLADRDLNRCSENLKIMCDSEETITYQSVQDKNKNEYILRRGSVLVLEKYKIEMYRDILKLKDKLNESKVLVFTDIQLIGHESVKEDQEENESEHEDENNNYLRRREFIIIPDTERDTTRIDDYERYDIGALERQISCAMTDDEDFPIGLGSSRGRRKSGIRSSELFTIEKKINSESTRDEFKNEKVSDIDDDDDVMYLTEMKKKTTKKKSMF